jgi:transcriptional regulator with XRE-family HTH domain
MDFPNRIDTVFSKPAKIIAMGTRTPKRQKASSNNRLRARRLALGLTLEEVAERAHMSLITVQRKETGERQLRVHELEALAVALECEPEDLLPDSARTVPVVGRVGAGARVYPFDDHVPGDGLYEVKCPPGMDPKKTVAVEVEGDSMWPIDSGWVLFYSRAEEAVASQVIGKMCVVRVAGDGLTLVKRVARGSKPGLFTLRSTNAADIEDVALEWAAPVRVYMAPDQAKAA